MSYSLKEDFFFNKGYSGFGKSIEYCEKAINVDPDFAPAYSLLAIVYWAKSLVFSLPSKEMWPKAKKLTLRALEIDEMDANAHIFMGEDQVML